MFSLAALVSPRGARIDFVGDMAVILLLLGHNENKLKNFRRSRGTGSGGGNNRGQHRANRKGHR